MVFFIGREKEEGFEPIAVRLSGGQSLPPVFALVATIFFALGQKCKSNPSSSAKNTQPHCGWVFFSIEWGFEEGGLAQQDPPVSIADTGG